MLDIATSILKQAGEIVSSYYGKSEVIFKHGPDGRLDSLTKADIESEAIITKLIKANFPSHGIYGEEGTRKDNSADYIWYIDPIDGTTNFTHSIPLFGISLGLSYKKEPILGTLYFPELKLLLSAEKGKGAFANNSPIHVSKKPLVESLYYISTAEVRDGWTFPSLKNSVGWVRSIDASSYEFASIAMGHAELYTFKKSPHDMVAGVVIVQEAGGRVTDEKGNNWNTDSNFIIASNNSIHEEVLHIIKEDLHG